MSIIKSELKFEDFPYICRICLYKGDTKPFTQALQNIVSSFSNITIEEEEELPKNICSNCVNRLEDIKVFIDLVTVNFEHLKDILLRHKLKLSLEYFDNDTKFEISEEESIVDENDTANETALPDIKDVDSDEDVHIKVEENEQIQKHQFHCKICKNVFISVKDLKEHRKQNKDCAFKCETCNETFESSKILYNHRIENEKCKIEEYRCHVCTRAFKKKSLLKKHAGVHSNDTPYECKLCDKKFKFSQNLRRHDKIVHKGVKPFKCDVCGKEFTSFLSKKDHINQHIEEPLYVCPICKDSFTYEEEFFLHKDVHTGKSGTKKTAKPIKICEIKLQCNFCNKVFTSKSNLRKHLLYHGEKKHLCVTCGKTFYLKQQLDEHFLLHTGVKPHKCGECGKAFRLYNYYKAHMLTHTGERPYQCNICKQSFMQKSHLTRHLNTHSGQKPFDCKICGKMFSNKSYLGIHNKIHTGETTHRCPVCSKGFFDTSNLKRHLAIHN